MPGSFASREFPQPFSAVKDLPEDIARTMSMVAGAHMRSAPENGEAGARLRSSPDRRPSFEIYRANEVRRTSVLFSGGDWRCQFRSAAGAILAAGGGYNSEESCRAAVMALRNGAASARITARS